MCASGSVTTGVSANPGLNVSMDVGVSVSTSMKVNVRSI